MSVEDVFIGQKKMHPFWVFSDMFEGRHVGGKFLCFINHHYPPEMISLTEEVNKRGAEKLKDGSWLLEVKKESGADAKIGWGVGDSPQAAFRKAVYCAGYLKVKDAT